MKTTYLVLLLAFLNLSLFAQNVGINQANPTNSLHISPVTLGNSPLRIDGLQAYTVNEDTSLLVVNPINGVIRYMSTSELSSSIINNSFVTNLGDSLINNSTFISNFGDSLFVSQNFIDSLISNIYNNGDTLLTNTTFITNLGDTLINNNTFITNLGNTLLSNSTFVSNFGDSLFNSQNFIDSLTSNIYNNGDTLLYNTNFINSLRDSIDTDVDSVTLVGTILTIYENGNVASVDLSSLSDADADPTNELQTISESGNTVTLSNGGGSFTDTDTQLTEAQVDAYANNNGYLTSFTEVDGSITNELQTLTRSGSTASLSNGGGSISINDADASSTNEIQNLGFSGTTLSISDGNNVNLINLLNDNDWTISGVNQYSAVSGNVGIGVTNPSYKLQVNGDIYANGGWLRVSGNQGLYFETHGGGLYMTDATWIRTYGSKSFYHNTGSFRTDGTLQVGSSGATLNVPNGGDFAYRTSTLFANTSGNVGIGTNAPSTRLDVNGNARIRAIPTTTSTNVTPLYSDANGNIYKKPSNIGTGPKFIAPITVYVSTSATAGFVTFNAAPYIPAGATAVIVEAYVFLNSANTSTPTSGANQKRSYIRRDATGSSYNLIRGIATNTSGPQYFITTSSQGTYPCTTARTFQYSTMDFNGNIKIRLIGYY